MPRTYTIAACSLAAAAFALSSCSKSRSAGSGGLEALDTEGLLEPGTEVEFVPPRQAKDSSAAPGQGPSAESLGDAPASSDLSLGALRAEARVSAAPPMPDAATVRARVLSPGRALAHFEAFPALDVPAPPAVPFRPGPKAPERDAVTTVAALEDGGAPPAVAGAQVLEVLRVSPEGPVENSAGVSVSFSQPMVALTAISDSPPPAIELTPAVEGAWRWIDPYTAAFEPAQPFPRATTFNVRVPKGMGSSVGGALQQERTWSFFTRGPKLVRYAPTGGTQKRQPTILLAFDVPIAAGTASKIILREKDGKRTYAMRPATEGEETAAGIRDGKYGDKTREHWLAFVPAQRLPKATRMRVVVPEGIRAAQGDVASASEKSFTFRTHGDLRLSGGDCSYPCGKDSSLQVNFTNPLDVEPGEVPLTVTPAIKDMKVERWGDSLGITGKTRPIKYQVKVDRKIRDVFGQALVGKNEVTIDNGRRRSRYRDERLEGENFVVLHPKGPKRYPFVTAGYQELEVRVYKVAPKDFLHYAGYAQTFYDSVRNYNRFSFPRRPIARKDPPGTLVTTRRVRPERAKDPYNPFDLINVDLRSALGAGGLGHAVVAIKEVAKEKSRPAGLLAWVQSTKLGISAASDYVQGTVVYVSDLEDGSAVSGANVLAPGGPPISGETDSGGVAIIKGAPDEKNARSGYLVARRGNDEALLPWRGDSYWNARRSDRLVWYVFDDRKLYRPGEDVHVKGWLRRYVAREHGHIEMSDITGATVEWVARDSRRTEIAKGTVKVGMAQSLDGFDLSFSLPSDVNLGSVYIEMAIASDDRKARKKAGKKSLDNYSHRHSLRVEEFRRPEFEVALRVSPDTHIVGGKATVSATAKYLAGGPLAEAQLLWGLAGSPGYFSPPNQSDFYFGQEEPWWEHWHPRWGGIGGPSVRRISSSTDGTGEAHLALDWKGITGGRTMVVRTEATVTDVNRQSWTGATSMVVHPSTYYVGAQLESRFVRSGQPVELSLIVSDLEGKRIDGHPINVSLVGTESSCQLSSDAEKAALCTLTNPPDGMGEIWAEVKDPQQRTHRIRLYVWVGDGGLPRSEKADADSVRLVPDKEDYEPGDTLQVAIQAPFFPAEGTLTVRREGVMYRERFRMNGASTVKRIPLDDSHAPGVWVHVHLVGEGQGPKGKPGPAWAVGDRHFSVRPREKILTVRAAPKEAVMEPGAEAEVSVEVVDHQGRPVKNAEVALVAVDEAVLALADYRIPDPVPTFHSRRGAGATLEELRRWVVLAPPDIPDPQELSKRAAESMMGAGGLSMSAPVMDMAGEEAEADDAGEEGSDESPKLRKNFSALALFAPTVRTDGSGKATVEFTLPDNLTRYRITAVATAQSDQFGIGENTLTARKLLMVRPSPPRFANLGDDFELPIVLQNLGEETVTAEVAMRSARIRLTKAWGWEVEVPPQGRVEVRFPSVATHVGTAQAQVVVMAGKKGDAAQIEFPVWLPVTTEATAVYGEVDEGAVKQPVMVPNAALASYGGLQVTTASSALQRLGDAMVYLMTYPYPCTEQLSSRIIAAASLGDLVEAFELEQLPNKEQLARQLREDVRRLVGRQRSDGGFGFWDKGSIEIPFASIHAAHALYRAQEAGVQLDSSVLNRAKSYLRSVPRRVRERRGDSDITNEAVIATIASYAIYTRSLLGERTERDVKKLLQEPGILDLPLESVGWLLGATAVVKSGTRDPLADERQQLLQRLLNQGEETAAEMHFASTYERGGYLIMHSKRRVDAIALEAIIRAERESPVIGKIMRGLMNGQVNGRWYNTQENAFALLAMQQYFLAFESEVPDMEATVWFDGAYAGAQRYEGRSLESHRIEVPMSLLYDRLGGRGGLGDVVLGKQGPGRLYYRVGLQYAPESLRLPSLERGFSVARWYEAIDDPEDVARDEQGVWTIRAGARVRVKLVVRAQGPRHHVALVDPLPAGLEAVNPTLANTSKLDHEDARRWYRYWFQFQNLRDERVEAFTTTMYPGSYEYRYVARATTPGRFTAGPTKVEEMYQPETFGRSSTDTVVVKP